MKLIFHFESKNSEEFIISKNKALIGRGSDCDVVLHHDGFSRHHAVIELQGGEFFITDNNSTNGVFIDSKRIPASTRVPLNTFLNLQIASAFQVECIDDSASSMAWSAEEELRFPSAKSHPSKAEKTQNILSEGKPRVRSSSRPQTPTKNSLTDKPLVLIIPVLAIAVFYMFFESHGNPKEGASSDQRPPSQTEAVIISEFAPASSYSDFFQSKSCAAENASWCDAGKLVESKSEGIYADGKNLFVFLDMTDLISQQYSEKFSNHSELTKIELLMLRKVFVSNLIRKFSQQTLFDSLQCTAFIKTGQGPKLKVTTKVSRNLDFNKYDKFTVNGMLDQIINQGNDADYNEISGIYESRGLE